MNNLLISSLLIAATLMVSAKVVSLPLFNDTTNLSVFQLDVVDRDEGEDSSNVDVESKLYQLGLFVAKIDSSNLGEHSKNNSVTYSTRAPPA